MSAFAFLALLGFVSAIPVLASDNATDEEPEPVEADDPVEAEDSADLVEAGETEDTDQPEEPTTEPDPSLIEGTAGNDTLSSGGSFDPEDSESAPETLSGLAGDDLLIHEARDDAGELVLEGGLGNDTILANEVEFGNNTTLDGGAGDDVLRTDIFVTGTPGDSFDTFITGEGADRIEIVTFNTTSDENIDLGLLGTVTDFDTDEDMIFVDPSQVIAEIVAADDNEEERDFASEFTHEITLNEDRQGGFTDLEFTFTAISTGDQMTGILRLDGLTNLTEDDIAFGQLEPAAPLFVRDGSYAGV